MTYRIAVFMLAAMSPLAAQAATRTFQTQDYLPLAVGNSWTYRMDWWQDVGWFYYRDGYWPTSYPEFPIGKPRQVTFSILRTEIIDGDTYYVFSDVPEGWPAAPTHFVAGKKLRWDGNRLVEHDGTDSLSLFHFYEAPEDSFDVSFDTYRVDPEDAHGDTLVEVLTDLDPHSIEQANYTFYGVVDGFLSFRIVNFISGFGIANAQDSRATMDFEGFDLKQRTVLTGIRATLLMDDPPSGGTRSGTQSRRTIEYSDVYAAQLGQQPFPEGTDASGIPRSSWGQVKENR